MAYTGTNRIHDRMEKEASNERKYNSFQDKYISQNMYDESISLWEWYLWWDIVPTRDEKHLAIRDAKEMSKSLNKTCFIKECSFQGSICYQAQPKDIDQYMMKGFFSPITNYMYGKLKFMRNLVRTGKYPDLGKIAKDMEHPDSNAIQSHFFDVKRDNDYIYLKSKSILKNLEKSKKHFQKLKQNNVRVDTQWIYELWDWADIAKISDEYISRDYEKLIKTTELKIENDFSDSLSVCISNLTALKKLHIKMNIKEIPIEICFLPNLEVLNIECKNLTEIPKGIAQLQELRELHIHSDNVCQIPKEFGSLSKLDKLSLRSKKLNSLPKAVFTLNKLQELDISHCDINSFHESIAKLVNLKKLNISGNRFKNFPKSICGLTQLKELDLSSCYYTESLPEEIGRLTQLETLNLSFNNFTRIPEVITSLKALKKIDIDKEALDENIINWGESIKEFNLL